jgi:polar amino acid transport system substrate-binding protein
MPQIAIAGVLPRVDDTDEGGMGMLFSEGDPARDCVDTALEALTADGTLAALDEEWMQGAGDIPEITE